MKIDFDNFIKNIKSYINIKNTPFIIAIAGGSGSGKSFIAKKIEEKIGGKVLSMDDYILEEKGKEIGQWDLPEVWDLKRLKGDLIRLRKKEAIKKPIYNFVNSSEKKQEEFFNDFVIFEGNYALIEIFDNLTNFKIFIDAEEIVRLNRRIERDSKERGKTREKIVEQWNKFVQPMYKKYIEPQKRNADLIILNN